VTLRAVCVHGHFYQPPRENPWTGVVDHEASAAPLHDWNERITDECYRRNTAARLLDAEGRVSELVNTFARSSFNVGPTLMSWLERHAPDVHDGIVAADRDAVARTGHGGAIAQPFVHAIMPLSDARDRTTLVRWGVADFERRFGRRPEGMWLPETAVDVASLEALAAEGIRFTVLAPRQARRVRRLGARSWTDVSEGTVDTRRAYAVALPSGRSISVFCYDGATSQAVAFEGLLHSGERLAEHLLAGAGPDPVRASGTHGPTAPTSGPGVPLGHAVTDGESYGHHHRHGEMALAYALVALDHKRGVRLTTYARHLAEQPPVDQLDIVERSSWSCYHGIERWQSDCGCSTGGQPDWDQSWRAPLRRTVDVLRDRTRGPWERAATAVLGDPWAARDDYHEVAATMSRRARDAWLDRWVPGADAATRTRALALAEIQRHLLFSQTSCAWFFDDAAGIEPVQSLRHAARAAELAQRWLELPTGADLEAVVLHGLTGFRSNDPAEGDVASIWARRVRAHAVDARAATIGHRTSALAGGAPATPSGWTVTVVDEQALSGADGSRLVVGRAEVGEDALQGHELVRYAVVAAAGRTWGAAVPVGDVAGGAADDAREAVLDRVVPAFANGGADAVRSVLAELPGGAVGLDALPPAVRTTVAGAALAGTLAPVGAAGLEVGERLSELGQVLAGDGALLPRSLQLVAELALDADLRGELLGPEPDLTRVIALLDRAAVLGVTLGVLAGEGRPAASLRALVAGCAGDGTVPPSVDALRALAALARRAAVLPGWATDLGWFVQGATVAVRDTHLARVAARAAEGDGDAARWAAAFAELAVAAAVRVDPV
jgi:alpha-amylase/alpha-mannosidase (GH57 family)